MNTRTIRRLFLSRHRRYEKRFSKLFNKAIRGQWLYASRSLDTEQLPTQDLERAYQTMYLYIMGEEGVITWNLYMPDKQIDTKDITDAVARFFAPENQQQLRVFWETLMRTYLNTYLVTRVFEVSKTTARQIVAAIEQQRALGKSIDEIRKYLQQEARRQQIRANTIARTETTNAMNKAQVLALNSSGKEWEKSWRSLRDDRVRAGHVVADNHYDLSGRFIDMNDLFDVPLYEKGVRIDQKLAFPGDITNGATAGNVINCRCSLIFREKGQRYGFRRTNRYRYGMDKRN